MISPAEILLVDPQTAAEMLGLSRASLYKFIKSGRFGVEPVSFGKKILYSTAELRSYVDAGCPSADVWRQLKENKAGGK